MDRCRLVGEKRGDGRDEWDGWNGSEGTEAKGTEAKATMTQFAILYPDRFIPEG